MDAAQIKTLLFTAALALLIGLATVAASSARGESMERSGGGGPDVDGREKPIYDSVWKRKVSPQNKRWARRVAECESGSDPDAIGADGLYRGAFQFSLETWRSSPQTPGGDPIAFSYRTQAFVAVRLKTRDGKGHWPNCG